jgi:hypothetical protein
MIVGIAKVKKIEFFPADLTAVTGTLRLRGDNKSVQKVVAKLMRVGRMSVSPSVSTVF